MARKKKSEEQTEKSKKTGGSDTNRERGLVGVLVPMTPEDREFLKDVARLDGRKPMNEWCRDVLMEQARLRKAASDARIKEQQ